MLCKLCLEHKLSNFTWAWLLAMFVLYFALLVTITHILVWHVRKHLEKCLAFVNSTLLVFLWQSFLCACSELTGYLLASLHLLILNSRAGRGGCGTGVRTGHPLTTGMVVWFPVFPVHMVATLSCSWCVCSSLVAWFWIKHLLND